MKERFLSYLEKDNKKVVTPLTKELFMQVAGSTKVNNIIQRLATMKKGTKEYKELREELPLYIPMCLCPEDGVRPKKDRHNIESSGLCLHDFDDMEGDIREFYHEKVEPLVGKELNVALAHITSSGHGLRLVTDLPKGKSIEQYQREVAQLLGLKEKRDEKTKDPVRASFFPNQDYIIYIDEKQFFEHVGYEEGNLFGDEGNAEEQKAAETSVNEAEEQKAAEPAPYYNTGIQAPVISGAYTVMPSYDGIPLNLFIEEVVKRYCNNGELTEDGHQRDDLCFHAAVLLRPLTQSNFTVMVQLLSKRMQKVGFTDAEVRQKVQSAISRESRYSKSPSPEALSILNDIKNAREVIKPKYSMRHAPKMPKILEDIAKHYEPWLRDNVIISCLPLFAHALDGVKINYNGREKKLQFSVHILGPASCGKGYMFHLYKMLMAQFIDEDLETLRKENADAEKRKRNRQKQDADVEYHHYRKHQLECTVSKPFCYARVHNAGGHSMVMFTEEIKEFDVSMRAAGGFEHILLKSYDWGELSKGTMTDDAQNMNDNTCLNTFTAGTPENSIRFIGNNSDGLANRIIPIIMESRRGLPPCVPKKVSEKFKQQIDELITQLRAVGNGDFVLYEFPVLQRAINYWFQGPQGVYAQWRENHDDAWCDLANRAGEIAFRAGVVFWFLAGQPKGMNSHTDKHPAKIQQIIDAALWVADYVRTAQYTLVGTKMEETAKTINLGLRTGCNKKVFSDLPETFTFLDYKNKKVQNGENPSDDACYKNLERWAHDGYIKKVGGRMYKKQVESLFTA